MKVWLTNRPEEWLLILDNADDPSLDILSYLPVGSRGTIIVTSRNPELTALETVGSYELLAWIVMKRSPCSLGSAN